MHFSEAHLWPRIKQALKFAQKTRPESDYKPFDRLIRRARGFSKIRTFRKYKFRMACHVHVMDRKSCRNKREKKAAHKPQHRSHDTKRELHSDKSLQPWRFLSFARNRFRTFTECSSKSQMGQWQRREDTSSHAHETKCLLSYYLQLTGYKGRL